MKHLTLIAILAIFSLMFVMSGCIVDTITITGSIEGIVYDESGSAYADCEVYYYEAEYDAYGYYTYDQTADPAYTDVTGTDGSYSTEEIEAGGYFIVYDDSDDPNDVPYTTYVYVGDDETESGWESTAPEATILPADELTGLRIVITWATGDFDAYLSYPSMDNSALESTFDSAFYPDAYYGGTEAPDPFNAGVFYDSSCEYETNLKARGVLWSGADTYTSGGPGVPTDCTTMPLEALKYTKDATAREIIINVNYLTAGIQDWYARENPYAADGVEYHLGYGLLTVRDNNATAPDFEDSGIAYSNLLVSVYNSEGLLSAFTAPMVYQTGYQVPFINWRAMEIFFYSVIDESYVGEEYRQRVDLIPYGVDNRDLLRGTASIATVDMGGFGGR
jgi:hypothetical protein